MDTKAYLRDLAKLQLELANTEENKQREKDWYAHNELKGNRTMVVFEEETFKQELYTVKCEDENERKLEEQMLQTISAHELIGDDKVVPNFINAPVKIDMKLFGVDKKRVTAKEGLGFHDEPVLSDLESDLQKLSPSEFIFNEKETTAFENMAGELVGDILPIRRMNDVNCWHFTPTQHVVNLMGMENMFYAMMDTPDEFHQLMRFIIDDCKRFLRWQEEKGLIFANSANNYMGSGSFCFNNTLAKSGAVCSANTWGHMNSQESVGLSPDMFGEFIFPYYKELAAEFGLLYYGCCEPVNVVWDKYISTIPNLRKVSISAWCDEEYMAQKLSNSNIIYSRKPSPNFVGVNEQLDEEAFENYLKKTIDLTRDCHTEIIFRDVYTVHNNPSKARRAVEIARKLIQTV